MTTCNICNKRMPENVLARHIELRHSEEPKEVVPTPPPVRIEPTEISALRWDFQKPETCAVCKEEHPSLLMVYHAHIKHGT